MKMFTSAPSSLEPLRHSTKALLPASTSTTYNNINKITENNKKTTYDDALSRSSPISTCLHSSPPSPSLRSETLTCPSSKCVSLVFSLSPFQPSDPDADAGTGTNNALDTALPTCPPHPPVSPLDESLFSAVAVAGEALRGSTTAVQGWSLAESKAGRVGSVVLKEARETSATVYEKEDGR